MLPRWTQGQMWYNSRDVQDMRLIWHCIVSSSLSMATRVRPAGLRGNPHGSGNAAPTADARQNGRAVPTSRVLTDELRCIGGAG